MNFTPENPNLTEKDPGKHYALIRSQLKALSDGVRYRTTILANASALLAQALTDINWAGFYLLHGSDLILGPFQGLPACTVIPFGKGVCGTAVAEERTQRVPDVEAFPGHIACDSASRSEIVIPIRLGGKICAVLDIDSPVRGRFSEEDEKGLESFVRELEAILENAE